MPGYQQIIIGLAPDDGLGMTNRAAWTATDAMFAELFASLANTVDLVTYTADMATQGAAIITLNAALAGKADTSALLSYPTFAQIVRVDIPQVLLLAAKRQAAANGGHYVTLPFELLQPGIDIDGGGGAWEWDLPRFPQDFSIVDAYLTATELTGVIDPGDFNVTGTLEDGITPIIGQCTVVDMDAAGVTPVPIINPESLVAKGRGITLSIAVTKTDAYAGTAKGLTLWLRGVWKS